MSEETQETITVNAEEAQGTEEGQELVAVSEEAQSPTVVQDFEGDNDFSMGDNIKSSKMDKFKLAEGKTARVAFVLINKEGHPVFKNNKTFYHEPTRKTVKVPDEDTKENQELMTLITKKVGKAPKPKFSFVVAEYTTAGNKVVSQDVELKALVIPEDKFKALKAVHLEMGLGTHDIVVQCVGEKYQDYNFIACKERLLEKFEDIQAIVDESTQLYTDGLPSFMGIPMDAKEIQELLADPVDTAMDTTANPFGAQTNVPPVAGQIANQSAFAGQIESQELPPVSN